MGSSTELFTNISFYKEHYSTKKEVQTELDSVRKQLKGIEESIMGLALITEPKKFCEDDEDPIYYLQNRTKECLEMFEDLYWQKFKLELLLGAWDNCFDEEGYAKPLPEGVDWDSSFIDGDFVKHKEDFDDYI